MEPLIDDETALTGLSSALTVKEAFDRLDTGLQPMELVSLFCDWLSSQSQFQRANFTAEDLHSSSATCLQTVTSCFPVPMPSQPLSQHRCVAAKSYYGRPRYDFVQIDGGDERWFGELVQIFHYTDTNPRAEATAVVLLRVYKTDETKHWLYKVPVITSEHSYQFVSVRAIDHRVLVRRDFRRPEHLFVHM